MRSQIQKWGNSLALKIPQSFAIATGLEAGTVIDLAVVNGKLIVTPQPEAFSLETLLAGITPDNLHNGQDFGGAAGQEVW